MNLRTIAILTASVAVVSLSAASASAVGETDTDYPPPEYCAITANPSQLTVGGTTTITVVDKPSVQTQLAVTSNQPVVTANAIEIAGGQTQTTAADGSATFQVRLNAPGTYSVGGSAGGGKVCTLSVTVAATVPEEPEEDPDPGVLGEEDVESADALAATGASTLPYLAAAAAMAAAGTAAVVVSRRRKQS